MFVFLAILDVEKVESMSSEYSTSASPNPFKQVETITPTTNVSGTLNQ